MKWLKSIKVYIKISGSKLFISNIKYVFIVRELLYFFTGDNFTDIYTYKQEKCAFLILQRLFSNIDNNFSIFFLCFTSNKNFYLLFALLFQPFIKNVPLCCNVALSFDKWRVPPRRLFSRPDGMVRTPHSLPGPPSTYRPGRRIDWLIDWLIDWSVLMFKTYRKSLSQLSYKRLTIEIKWV